MKFKKLAEYFQKLESTASRNEMTEILAEIFRLADRQEIDKICYLSLGCLAPDYVGLEFNLAEKMMIRALSQAYGQQDAVRRQNTKKSGTWVTWRFSLISGKNQNRFR